MVPQVECSIIITCWNYINALILVNFKDLFYLYECFVGILCACLVPVESRCTGIMDGCIPPCGARTEPRSSARAVNAFNFWAVFPASLLTLEKNVTAFCIESEL